MAQVGGCSGIRLPAFLGVLPLFSVFSGVSPLFSVFSGVSPMFFHVVSSEI
jgi:hypothetical protein